MDHWRFRLPDEDTADLLGTPLRYERAFREPRNEFAYTAIEHVSCALSAENKQPTLRLYGEETKEKKAVLITAELRSPRTGQHDGDLGGWY